MIRLKWVKHNNILEIEPILIGLVFYQCFIYLDTLELNIRNSKGVSFQYFKQKNLQEMKSLARLELIKLGANFGDEIRKRRKKL